MPTTTTPAPTFEDVWRTIQELARTQREFALDADRRQQEADRRQQEADNRQQEADRQRQETERLMKESRQETERVMKESRLETERLMKESRQEVDRQLKILSKQLGAHGNRLGEFVQEMVRPAVVRLFRERDLPVHQVLSNLRAYDDNRQFIMEIDLLVVNTDTAIAVECKSHLTQADVDEHLERLGQFKQCFPQYAPHILLGAVAAMVLPDEVGRYAYRKGLFVLAQAGEAMEIRNDGAFQPQMW